MPIRHLVRKVRTYGEINPDEPPRQRQPKSPKNRKTAIKKILLLGGAAALAFFIFGSIVVAVLGSQLPDPNRLNEMNIAQSTKIYDRTGAHILYEIYQNQKRTLVSLDQMSPYLPKAVVAIEDKYFYQHSGIRVLSILRALFNNFIGRKVGSGGASTITQQFLKNAVLGDKPGKWETAKRKIKEVLLAPRIEKKYTKDQILQMYLNQIPFGSTNYGVEAAAQGYFGKSAKDLTLAESATMAAIIQAPSRYLNNPEALKGRRDYVLSLMQSQGYISADEMDKAKGDTVKITRGSGIKAAPHFVLYVKQLLADELGENAIDTGGYKVITTLDYDMQLTAEKIVKEQGDKFAKSANANNAALVAIDPKTAQILAMVGSRDFSNEEIDGQFNVAVLGKRQPGSSFKPFVYTAAFEKGYTPETVLYDVTTNFDLRTGGKYMPKNYDGKEHGLLTMRKALQGSLNIPAVKTMYLVGGEKVAEFSKRFGYTTLNKAEIDRAGLSLVLGGAEVNLLEHTNAYATLADNGVYHKPVSILSISAPDKTVVKEWKQDDGTEAIKPELAATISSILTDNAARAYIFGLNNNLVLPDRLVAAKTGTTNDNKDAWTLGYTPSIATGVWVGNTIPTPMKAGGNTLAGVIWNQFMREATKKMPKEKFPEPPANDAAKPVLRGNDGGIKLAINNITGKISTSSTPSDLIIEKTYLPPHDILYYVNKDDPRGPAPANPADDPQYQNWENALQGWVERMTKAGTPISLEEPPLEVDTLVTNELSPVVEFLYPPANQAVEDRHIIFEVKASAPRGVSRVTFFLDGLNIGVVNSHPFKLNYYAQKLANGKHVILAIAEDDIKNIGQAQVEFDLTAAQEPPNVDWAENNPLILLPEDFPRALSLAPFRWDDINKINIYLVSNEKKLIYAFFHPDDVLLAGKLHFTWNHYPGVGHYTLIAEIVDQNNSVIVSKNLNVEVK